MQSGAGAAAAGRGHHAPRCCHSCSVLTQTRDTDTRIHSHMKVEVFQPYIGPPYSIDQQYNTVQSIQLVCHFHLQMPNLRRNKLEGRRKILQLSWRLILILIVAFSFGEVVKYCKRLAANCISSHLNCSVPFIFLAPNTACHCRHKHLLRAASCLLADISNTQLQ